MFRQYDIKARLFPAALTLVPAIAAAVFLVPGSATWEAGATIVVLSCASAYAASLKIASMGRALQDQLFARWGGPPSVQVLRHRDQSFSAAEKKRIHSALANKAAVQMPSEQDEQTNPAWADQQYQVCSDWLRRNTYDAAKHPIVFERNVEYGFYRNGFAARIVVLYIGSCVSVAVASVALTRLHFLGADPFPTRFILESGWTIGLAWLWVGVYMRVFSERRIQEAAFSYAKALTERYDAI